MPQWQYKVAFVDYRGRISVEGDEFTIGEERRTAFLRRFLDDAGKEGWELTGIQPLSPHTAYYILKRAGASQSAEDDSPAAAV